LSKFEFGIAGNLHPNAVNGVRFEEPPLIRSLVKMPKPGLLVIAKKPTNIKNIKSIT
jgi:hypothetical protein